MLDYVLMPRRYRSSVTKGQVTWGHWLVEVQWRFGVRCDVKSTPKRDYVALKEDEVRKEHNAAIEKALEVEAVRLMLQRSFGGVRRALPYCIHVMLTRFVKPYCIHAGSLSIACIACMVYI